MSHILFISNKVRLYKPDVSNIKPVGMGGTSFHCIFNKLRECNEDEMPVGIVILTDGYAQMPEEDDALGVPVMWIIIDSEIEPSWGKVVHINE